MERKMPIKPHPTDPDKVVFVSHKTIPSYENLLDAIEKLKARIAVLERALVALDKDYEKLLKEQGATVDDAWQKYCEVMMPQKATHVYPLSGAMYTIFVKGWNAALKEKK